MNFLRNAMLAAMIISGVSTAVHAGVIIGGTRVIFDGNKKEAAISINNPDTSPYLIQSWIETPAGGVEKAPFIITPPLYRLDKGQQNVERIVLAGSLPQNKESLFWLNIKAIPSSAKVDNTLQIAVKTRIKLIYRPAAMKGAIPDEAADKLVWKRSGQQLQVFNSTPFVMNFNEISVGGKKINEVSYVLPGTATTFALPQAVNNAEVKFKIINDFGSPGSEHISRL